MNITEEEVQKLLNMTESQRDKYQSEVSGISEWQIKQIKESIDKEIDEYAKMLSAITKKCMNDCKALPGCNSSIGKATVMAGVAKVLMDYSFNIHAIAAGSKESFIAAVPSLTALAIKNTLEKKWN